MPTTDVVTGSCPQCGQSLDHAATGPAWCPDCEWNLQEFDDLRRFKTHTRIARRSHRIAFTFNERMFRDLAARLPVRASLTPTRVVLLLASLLLTSAAVASVLVGAALILRGTAALKFLGLLLVLVGVDLRPRMPALKRTGTRANRTQLPHLFSVVDAAAARLGTPTVEVIVLTDTYNAWSGRFGLRRRRALGIGLPLWASLSPAGRTALLGHELGHFVNGDPERGLGTQSVLTTFGRLAQLVDPRGITRRAVRSASAYDDCHPVFDFITHLVLAPVYYLFRCLQLGLHAMAARDRIRAEYLADAMAVELAGRDATIELLSTMMFLEPVRTEIRRAARASCAPADWKAAASQALERSLPAGRRAEQLTIRRDASLIARHPPLGHRLRLVRTRHDPWRALDVDARLHERVDAELAPVYSRVARALISQ